jgi:hypothetical protein
MADVLQHLQRGGPDVEFVRLAADRLHQAAGLLQRALTGSKTRHRIGKDIAPRITQPIDRLRRHQQRLR